MLYIQFSNKEEGITSRVYELVAGWRVTLYDDDAGLIVPVFKTFPTEHKQAALDYAQLLVA
jgi:hypothetical protein